MRTSDSTEKLVEALVAARAKYEPVIKAQVGQVAQNREYRYADLSTLVDAVTPALLANGLIVLQAVDAESAALITRIAHTSGQWAEASYPLKLDLAPQAFGSALTYARRYSLQGLLFVSAEDDDGASAQPTTRASKKTATRANIPTDQRPAVAQETERAASPVVVNPKNRPELEAATASQLRKVRAEADRYQWPKAELKAVVCERFGVESSRELRRGDIDGVLEIIRRGPSSAKMPPPREPGSDDVVPF